MDDDRDVRTALSDLLTRWGGKFETAVDADDALVRIETGERYGLVLADYRLPGPLNGLDLIAAITKRHPLPVPACALITGDFDPGLIAAAHARGIPLFHKPLKSARLRSLLGIVPRSRCFGGLPGPQDARDRPSGQESRMHLSHLRTTHSE